MASLSERAREDATLLQSLLRSRATAMHTSPRTGSEPSRSVNVPTLSTRSDEFADLWDNALDNYFTRTGVNLRDRDQDLYRRLQGCSSSDSVVQVLEDIALDFKTYRQGSERANKIRSALSSVAYGISVLVEVGAESAASKSFPGGKAIFVAIAILIKATQGVSQRFDALVAILEKFGFYLSRLPIRMDIGLGTESRRLTIQLLSKMVHTFALATETMKKSRTHHFINVFLNKNDETHDLTQSVGVLVEEDARLGLVEMHRAVSHLSDKMDSLLAHAYSYSERQPESTLLDLQDELASVKEITRTGFATLTAHMPLATGSREEARPPTTRSIPNSVSPFFTTWEERTSLASTIEDGLDDCVTPVQRQSSAEIDRMAERIRALELAQDSIHEQLAQKEGSSWEWKLWARMSLLKPALLTRMVNELHATFRDLTPDDRAALREGIAALYAAVNMTVTGAADGGTTITAWFAVLLNPGAVFTAFLPLAAAYTVAYLGWQRVHSSSSVTNLRRLHDPRMDTIILIDVLGVHMLLPLDRVGTWMELHALLVHHFTNREGVEYVRNQAYMIMHPHGDSVIRPNSWTRIIRGGLTLEMSIVLRRRFLDCPYCGTAAHRPLEGRTECVSCHRQYWATNADTSDPDGNQMKEPGASPLGSPNEPLSALSKDASPVSDGSLDSPNSPGFDSFRRITVLHAAAVRLPADAPSTEGSLHVQSPVPIPAPSVIPSSEVPRSPVFDHAKERPPSRPISPITHRLATHSYPVASSSLPPETVVIPPRVKIAPLPNRRREELRSRSRSPLSRASSSTPTRTEPRSPNDKSHPYGAELDRELMSNHLARVWPQGLHPPRSRRSSMRSSTSRATDDDGDTTSGMRRRRTSPKSRAGDAPSHSKSGRMGSLTPTVAMTGAPDPLKRNIGPDKAIAKGKQDGGQEGYTSNTSATESSEQYYTPPEGNVTSSS
ncbi:unnamed protein product [Peniophora sp. CBMAI 1063]|nr:unnamed protein product [Peniophora sp. CBMAI 1063]